MPKRPVVGAGVLTLIAGLTLAGASLAPPARAESYCTNSNPSPPPNAQCVYYAPAGSGWPGGGYCWTGYKMFTADGQYLPSGCEFYFNGPGEYQRTNWPQLLGPFWPNEKDHPGGGDSATADDAPAEPAKGSIADLVENTEAEEMPFWAYLYDNGFGYLDRERVSNDSKIVCANRKAGLPENQIVELLKIRGYSASEAQAIVAAASIETIAHPICPL